MSEASEIVTSPNQVQIQPWARRLLFFGLLTLDFFGFACYSVMGPIFPPEAARKGLSQTVIGLVFSTYALTMLISSPIFGHYVSGPGPKVFLIGGGILNAAAIISFGFLNAIVDVSAFATMCFVMRILEATGFAAVNVSVFAIVGRLYPESLGFAMSYVEIAIGFGQAFGPAAGSMLFYLGGYSAPYLAMGLVLLVTCIGLYFMINYIPQNATDTHGTRKEGRSLSLWKFLMIPSALITLLGLFSSAAGSTLLIPLLAIHVQQEFGIDERTSGYIFSSQLVTYATMSIVTGKLSDKFPRHRHLMLITGMTLISLSLVFLGPSPILTLIGIPDTSSTVMTVIGLAFLGAGGAFVFTPTYQILMDNATEAGYDHDTVTLGVVGGSWNASFTLGSMTAPTVGSVLTDTIGYRWATTVGAAIPFTFMVITSIFVNYRRCKRPRGLLQEPNSAVSYSSMDKTVMPDDE